MDTDSPETLPSLLPAAVPVHLEGLVETAMRFQWHRRFITQ